jgi:transcription antitermination factor NusG
LGGEQQGGRILTLKENPPPLFPADESVWTNDGQWWVAHTKSRAEKAFAWNLSRRNIGYFLPLIKRISIHGGKRRQVLHPVFPSYVFFCGSNEDRYQALLTGHLFQVLVVRNKQELIDQLQAIQRVLSFPGIQSYPILSPGRWCRVCAGALAGLEGKVVGEANGNSRIVLEVTMLGQGVVVEVDSGLLEPI